MSAQLTQQDNSERKLLKAIDRDMTIYTDLGFSAREAKIMACHMHNRPDLCEDDEREAQLDQGDELEEILEQYTPANHAPPPAPEEHEAVAAQ